MKKQMNIVLTALSVITLMGVVSCNKVEELEGNGSTIRFGVSTIYENGPATKTEYSGKDQNNNSISSTSTAERIDWLDTDQIRIQCAQASVEGSSDKYADYAITPGSAGSTQIHTATIAPVGKGLQWGTGSHDFYALYPSTVQNGASTIAVSGTGATVGGTIPATQTATKSGYIFKPDMDYAYMYAVKAGATEGSDVSLDFHPLVTTLEFTLLTKAGDPITSNLTSVKLSSSQTTSYLTGTFTAELTTSGLTAVTMGDITSGGNEITITLPDGGVQLSTDPAEAYKVTFLTLPLDQTELTLTLGFADSSKRTLQLKDNGSWITVDACKKTYIWKLDAPKTVSTGASISGGTGMFGDVYLTNGLLKKTDSTFSIEEDPFVLCTAYGQGAPSQGSSSGTRYYFNYIELGQYFSGDASFDENSGNIPAVQTVSYNGHDWRMPSQSEWAAATTTAGRTGSTVNGTSGARFALVLVDLTGSSYAGMGLTSSDGYSMESNSNYIAALLLFPDGATVTCDSINAISINGNAGYASSTVSYADISTLVSGGCIVLPAAGRYNSSDWYGGGTEGYYWSGTEYDPDNGYDLYFGNGGVGPDDILNKSYFFFPVVLARGTAEISGGTGKFGDAYLTNGILKKTDSTFSIEEDPFVLCTAYGQGTPSQGSSSGTRYYFNYIELGQYFSNNASFDGNSGNIPAVQTVSYNGQDWRMPSRSEWAAATTTAGRTGSTVNGTGGARYALVLVDLTGSVHEGEGLTSSDGSSMESNSNYMAALLLFPDGATVTCDSINASSINSSSASFATSTVSYGDISILVSGGCIVLPAAGSYITMDWYYGGTYGYYWSGTESGANDGYGLFFDNGNVYPVYDFSKSYDFFPVVLAREDTSSSTSISGGTGMFGDIYLTNGLLKKTDATFSIEEDPFVLCTAYGQGAHSQGSSSGTRYYFNYIELGQYFSNNASFDENSGNIPAVQTVSYNGHDWRMPSQVEWAAATTTAGRTGSTVNGTGGARYAKVLVDLRGSSYAGMGLTTSDGGQGTSTNYMAAMLLFPDGATVTCGSINTSCINNTTGEFATSTVSYADISTLVSGGCVILPAAGHYYGDDYYGSNWIVGGSDGCYWSGTDRGDTIAGYYLDFGNGGVDPDGLFNKSFDFFPVVLARGTTEISGGTGMFGDIYLTNGILKKDGSTFSIEEDPFVLCTAYGQGAPSQGSSSGTRYYFNYIELWQYFSGDASFDEDLGSIPAVQTVSYNGHDWRMPRHVEWAAATTTAGRTGSTVNGTSGARYALVLVDLTGSVHEGEGLASSDGQSQETNSNYMAALLLFPDGATVTCDSINSSSINSSESFATSTVSYADISTLVSGGCIVLPAAGYYNDIYWYDGGTYGRYWSGTAYASYSGYSLYFCDRYVYPDLSNGASNYFFPVVLAR